MNNSESPSAARIMYDLELAERTEREKDMKEKIAELDNEERGRVNDAIYY
jgi:hypothetical protein